MARISASLEARISKLEAQFQALRADVYEWQVDHTRYHADHESHWGLVRLMRDHPLRTALSGLLAGALLAGALSDHSGAGRFIVALLRGWFN